MISEVIGVLEREPHVGHIQHRGQRVLQHPHGIDHGNEQHDRDGREDRDGERCGQDASRPTCVEPAEVDPSVADDAAHQVPRDQEPGDHEEHIDADIPARQEREPGVVEQDEPHGDRPQSLDVGTEGGLRRAGDACSRQCAP